MFDKMIMRGLTAVALAGVAVSFAQADSFTYNIVDYPLYETDSTTGRTDTISGTILTNTNDRPITNSSSATITGGTVTLTNSLNGSYSIPIIFPQPIIGTITATPTSLSLVPSETWNALIFQTYIYQPPNYPLVFLQYQQNPAAGYDEIQGGSCIDNGEAPPDYSLLFTGYAEDPPGLPLGGAAGQPMVIATALPVPETATVTLLGTALSGLGVVYLRRRRAKTQEHTTAIRIQIRTATIVLLFPIPFLGQR